MSATNWRYVCPICGSCSTRMRSTAARGHALEGDGSHHYCDVCEQPIDALYDKKTGVEVQKMSETLHR